MVNIKLTVSISRFFLLYEIRRQGRGKGKIEYMPVFASATDDSGN